jgi:hypothetical protein
MDHGHFGGIGGILETLSGRMIAMVEQVITVVVESLISLAAATVTAYVIPWIQRHVRSEKIQQAMTIGGVVVNAVEQSAVSGLISLPKKDEAVKRLRE